MGKAARDIILGSVLVLAAFAAKAQPDRSPAVESKAAEISAMFRALPAAKRCTQGTVPALTVVKLRLHETLDTRTSKIGQTFAFELAAPVMLGDCVAIPGGVPGQGEIIHVKKATLTGAGGEFVGAARFLDFEGRQIPLRSLQLRVDGGVERTYNRVTVYDLEFPAGMVVEAKLAQPFEVAPAA